MKILISSLLALVALFLLSRGESCKDDFAELTLPIICFIAISYIVGSELAKLF